MPFGIKNAGTTFQRAMDISFAKEIHDFLVIYLDDLIDFSKSDQEHLDYLRQVFLICRKYGISLNPKKSLFNLEEGKLLGHIISKEGIRIDPDRIQAILQVPHPRNIKELQSFLAKINFLRRFIPNLAELIRLLKNMLKKDSKDDQGCEKPIAFFSKALRDAPLKYQIMEKQAYALVKAIKDFRVYILYSHVIAYVPNTVVKDILTQEGIEGKRGKWIAMILEYDIEIKPRKLIKGQGLAKLMTETNFQALDINQLDNEQEMATLQINQAFLQSPWAGFYWPTLFTDVKKYVTSCHKCQIFEGKKKLLPLPLKPISTEKPFQQWGLDFIGEIHPSSATQHKWILTATNYFTKWIEAIPCRQANDLVIMQFLETNILSTFGCPRKIITDNAVAFKSKRMINFCHKYHITLGHSTTYYPQGNGLAESSNKSLINMIKKVLEENKKNWHKNLVNALWANRLTTKRSIGTSPYQLVYGMEAVFPSSLGILVIKLL
eukprot:PITA_04921